MSDYRAGAGHDVALGSLTVLAPQPRSVGVQYTRTAYSASGVAYKEAPFVELMWDILQDATDYQTLLGVFGLSSAQSAAVTVYVRNDRFSYVRYNGRAIAPEPGRTVDWDIFPRNIKIIVRDLEAAR